MKSGTLLGERFRLGLRLARSRLGEVFSAKDEQFNYPCRVELIYRSGHAAGGIAELLAREVAIGDLLDQPAMIGALGWGHLGGHGFFVARRVEPGTHPLILRKGSLDKRLFMLFEAACVVEVLSALGGAHRNLAPANLLQGHGVFLSGFTYARLDGIPEPPLDLRGIPLSLLPAAAPEVLLSFEDAGAPADVYSLGAILFNLLTSKWPSQDATLVEALQRARDLERGESTTPSPADRVIDAPETLVTLCVSALAFAPQDRPVAGAFAGALAQWLELNHTPVQLPRARGTGPAPALDSSFEFENRIPAIGSLLGNRFHLGRALERSRNGEVFKGTEDETFAPCHIELILSSGQEAEDSGDLAQREVRIGQFLEGEGFVKAVSWGRLGPDLLFVARQAKTVQPLDLHSGDTGTKVRRLLKAARRVDVLASGGGVHRNLGPLTLGEVDGLVVLTDFSLVKLEDIPEPPLDSRGVQFSWLPCAAPELLVDFEGATPSADVYALGVLLFMALTGQAPYAGPTLADLLGQHDTVRRGDELPPRAKRRASGVHPNLDRLSFRALNLDPNKRPSIRAFTLALSEWLELEGEPEEESADDLARAKSKRLRAERLSEEARAQRLEATQAVARVRARKAKTEEEAKKAEAEAQAKLEESQKIRLADIRAEVAAQQRIQEADAVEQALQAEARAKTKRREAEATARRAEAEAALVEAEASRTEAVAEIARAQADLAEAETTSLPEEEEEEEDELEAIPADEAAALLSRLLSPVVVEEDDDDEFEASSDSISVEFDSEVLAPAGLEAHLDDFKYACSSCGTPVYLLPPLSPENTRCKDCEQVLERYDSEKHDPLCEVTQQQRAAESKIPGLEDSDDSLTSSSDSAVIRLQFPQRMIGPAGLETPLSKYRHVCQACGKQAYLLPPQTPENTQCQDCKGALVPTANQREVVRTAAEEPPAAPEPVTRSPMELDEGDEPVRDESGEGTGYVQFRSTARFARPKKRDSDESDSLEAAASFLDSTYSRTATRPRLRKRRPGGTRIIGSKPKTKTLDEFQRVDRKAPKRRAGLNAFLVKAALGAGLLIAAGYGMWALREPEIVKVAAPAPPPFAPELPGRYKLVVGETAGLEANSRWCYLDLVQANHPTRLLATAWRPDDQTIVCSESRAQGRRIHVKLTRDYDWNGTAVTETWQLAGSLEIVLPKQAPVEDEDEEDEDEDGARSQRAPTVAIRGMLHVVTRIEGSETKRVRRYRFLAFKTPISKRMAAMAFHDQLDAAELKKAKLVKARAREARKIKKMISRGRG